MTTGLWALFSDVDEMTQLITEANQVYVIAAVPPNKALLGTAAPKPPAPLRARHASSIGAADMPTYMPKTVFDEVLTMEGGGLQEMQWAVMTLLAIDRTARERVARLSPPTAARLTRSLPQRFERYIMGASGTASMTPYEAVCDWTLRIEIAYKSVEET